MRASVVNYCAEIGKDPLLVQGAGGNVSWKDGDTLWVKASGTWLADAAVKEIFVPVDLPHLKNEIAGGNFGVTPRLSGESSLRPSIETLLHALMPHKVVVHVHAIEVLARLVREDFDTHVAVPLGNRLKWIKVEYKKPGADLARAVHEALAERSDADIVFLRNHGVVIGGSDIADIDSKLRLLVSLLESPVCETVPTRTAVKALKVNSGVEYQPIVDGSLHQLALNPALFERLGADWALYPDHVVFLGAQAHCYEDEKEFIESVVHNEVMPELAFIRGGGVLAQAGFSQAKQAQLRCYADVITRQPRDCALSSLSRSQIGELLNWDAERYRQQMAK